MPSPVGHALAGLALGWVAQRAAGPAGPVDGRSRLGRAVTGYPAIGAALALLPDLDLLLNSHRTASHSLGGAVVAGGVGVVLALALRRSPVVTGALFAAAFASHALLDWLGRDTSAPQGLMLLWPVSTMFYSSGVDLFAEVSRRYWSPDEFVFGNLRSVARELLILGPIAIAAYVCCGRRRRSPG